MKDILLKQNRSKPRIKRPNTLLSRNLAKATDKPTRKRRLRHQPDPRRLERTERDIGEELRRSRRSQVYGSAIIRRGFVAKLVDELLLEQLIASELEGALEEVSRRGGAKASPDGAGPLAGNDLPETANETAVVFKGVELYPGFDSGVWGLSVSLSFFTSSSAHVH